MLSTLITGNKMHNFLENDLNYKPTKVEIDKLKVLYLSEKLNYYFKTSNKEKLQIQMTSLSEFCRIFLKENKLILVRLFPK